MGNAIPVCTNYVSPVNELGLYGWSLTTACDEWTSPHILSPFLIAIIMFWPFFAFNVAGWWEAVEVLFVFISGGYIIFVNNIGSSDPNILTDDETFVMTFIEDWFIQGFLGSVFLGYLFLIWAKPPVLWKLADIYLSPKHFWFYGLSLLFYFGVYAIFPYVHEGSGVKVGQIIVIGWQPIWVGLVYWLEGRWLGTSKITENGRKMWTSGKWKGRDNVARMRFWGGFLAIALAFMIQNYFDWFFSGGVQSWVVTALVAAVLFVLIIYEYPGSHVIVVKRETRVVPRKEKK